MLKKFGKPGFIELTDHWLIQHRDKRPGKKIFLELSKIVGIARMKTKQGLFIKKEFKYCFSVHTKKRRWLLACQSESALIDWLIALEAVVSGVRSHFPSRYK